MWEIQNSLQLTSFIISALFGGTYCIIYDMLRAIRKIKRFSAVYVAIQDLIYFLIIGIVTFFIFLKYTCGEIRGYIFAALLAGFFAFRLTASRFLLRFFVFVFGRLYKLFLHFYKQFSTVKNKISEILVKYFKKIKKYCKNTFKNFKNYLKIKR